MTADSKQPLPSILLNPQRGHQTGYNFAALLKNEERTTVTYYSLY